MATPLVQTLFGDSVLGVLRALILAAVPDSWDWLPSTVLTVISAVDDIDRLEGTPGDEKLRAVVDTVVATLDEADDIPGWEDLDEMTRDDLISGLAEIVVFSIRAAQVGGLPDQAHREVFAGAVSDLILAVFELVDAFEQGKSTPAAMDSVTERIRERLAK